MIEPSNRKGWEQQEVLNYKKALDLGVDLIKSGMPFSTRLIQNLHKPHSQKQYTTPQTVRDHRNTRSTLIMTA